MSTSPTSSPLGNASPTRRGAITNEDQILAGIKKQVDLEYLNSPARRLLHPAVNVLDYGAVATSDGSVDCTAAIIEAIETKNTTGFLSLSTRVIFPPPPLGCAYWIRNLSVKRSALLEGCAGPSSYHSAWVKPFKGYSGFIMESYNTPVGTTDNGNAGFAMLSGLCIEPEAKCDPRPLDTVLTVGETFTHGTGIEDDTKRHFIVRVGGRTGTGPDSISWGNDQALKYKNLTHAFTVGREVQGQTSGAVGYVVSDANAGATGTLRLTIQLFDFQDNELVKEIGDDGQVIVGGGSCRADGVQTPDNSHIVDGEVEWEYIGLGAGVVMRTAAYVNNCSINSTSGAALHVEAQTREQPKAVCNANGWGFNTLTSFGCQGPNVFVRGSDANGGWGVGGYFLGGGGPTSDENFTGPTSNINDRSFLGNSYFSIQFGSGGCGPIISRSVGGGNTFDACYVEGTGGGWCQSSGTCTVIGGGLSVNTLWSPGSNPTVVGPGGSGRGLGQLISGSGGFPWGAHKVTVPGWRAYNSENNVYQCLSVSGDGKTGATEPTGTGSSIADGNVVWQYIRPFETNGQVTFGSADHEHPTALGIDWPEDVGTGQGYAHEYMTAVKHGDQVTKVGGWNYGDTTRTAHMMATNYTEYRPGGVAPFRVPAGMDLFFDIFLTGARWRCGTAAPTDGLCNKGDRVWYLGSAISPGGKQGLVCTTSGTAGTYTGGRTLTSAGGSSLAVSGALMQTLTAGQDFHTGDYLTVDGVPTRVTAVTKDGMTLTVADVIPAGTFAPSFTNPVFEEF